MGLDQDGVAGIDQRLDAGRGDAHPGFVIFYFLGYTDDHVGNASQGNASKCWWLAVILLFASHRLPSLSACCSPDGCPTFASAYVGRNGLFRLLRHVAHKRLPAKQPLLVDR